MILSLALRNTFSTSSISGPKGNQEKVWLVSLQKCSFFHWVRTYFLFENNCSTFAIETFSILAKNRCHLRRHGFYSDDAISNRERERERERVWHLFLVVARNEPTWTQSSVKMSSVARSLSGQQLKLDAGQLYYCIVSILRTRYRQRSKFPLINPRDRKRWITIFFPLSLARLERKLRLSTDGTEISCVGVN